MLIGKDPTKDSRVAVKDCWHPYGLQGLNPEKFVLISSKILLGKHGLINFSRKGALQEGKA